MVKIFSGVMSAQRSVGGDYGFHPVIFFTSGVTGSIRFYVREAIGSPKRFLSVELNYARL